MVVIELVDTISRDGPDTPIHVMHNKKLKSLKIYMLSKTNGFYLT